MAIVTTVKLYVKVKTTETNAAHAQRQSVPKITFTAQQLLARQTNAHHLLRQEW
jgi:hypothetical protein